MVDGLHVVFEGIDGAGKSTTLAAVRELLGSTHPGLDILSVRHPGATPLGQQLRLLNKYPERFDKAITIDALSAQLLMVVDSAAFVSQVLKPALTAGSLVLSDRSNFISSIAYGYADGLSLAQIRHMFSLVPQPRIDRLYVLQLSPEVAAQRLAGGDRQEPDRFERKGASFYRTIHEIYDSLIIGGRYGPELCALVNSSVGLENIRYVDATQPLPAVASEIARDIAKLLAGCS